MIDETNIPSKINCQIRYNGNLAEANLSFKNNRYSALFKEPQLAITPGQSIVFFDNEETLLGGGIIELVWVKA